MENKKNISSITDKQATEFSVKPATANIHQAILHCHSQLLHLLLRNQNMSLNI